MAGLSKRHLVPEFPCLNNLQTDPVVPSVARASAERTFMQRLGLERVRAASEWVTVVAFEGRNLHFAKIGWRYSAYMQHVRMQLSHNHGEFEQAPPSP